MGPALPNPMVGEVFGGTIIDIGIWNFVTGISLIRAFLAKSLQLDLNDFSK